MQAPKPREPVARDAFPGYDEPVNIDMEPEEALKVLLAPEPESESEEETT
jgi:hypothetical protein